MPRLHRRIYSLIKKQFARAYGAARSQKNAAEEKQCVYCAHSSQGAGNIERSAESFPKGFMFNQGIDKDMIRKAVLQACLLARGFLGWRLG